MVEVFYSFFCHAEKLPVFKKMETFNLSFSLSIFYKVDLKYIYIDLSDFSLGPPIALPSLQNWEEKERDCSVFSLFSTNFLLQFILSTTAQRTFNKKKYRKLL